MRTLPAAGCMHPCATCRDGGLSCPCLAEGGACLVLCVLASAALLLQAAPAGAVVRGAVTPRPRAETQLVLSSLGNGRGSPGSSPNANNPFDPVSDGYPDEQPDHRLHRQGRGLRRNHPCAAARQRRGAQPLLHRHPHHYEHRHRVCAGHLERQPTSRNVGYVARLLNEYYPNTDEPAAPDQSQPEGRRRAGGHLVLQRPLRAEHVRPAARRRGRDREQDQSRGAAGPAATAQPHRHPVAAERPRR